MKRINRDRSFSATSRLFRVLANRSLYERNTVVNSMTSTHPFKLPLPWGSSDQVKPHADVPPGKLFRKEKLRAGHHGPEDA
jgi:hypothetical protein